MMLADTIKGLRVLFAPRGWFETSIDILDDTAGSVGIGRIFYL